MFQRDKFPKSKTTSRFPSKNFSSATKEKFYQKNQKKQKLALKKKMFFTSENSAYSKKNHSTWTNWEDKENDMNYMNTRKEISIDEPSKNKDCLASFRDWDMDSYDYTYMTYEKEPNSNFKRTKYSKKKPSIDKTPVTSHATQAGSSSKEDFSASGEKIVFSKEDTHNGKKNINIDIFKEKFENFELYEKSSGLVKVHETQQFFIPKRKECEISSSGTLSQGNCSQGQVLPKTINPNPPTAGTNIPQNASEIAITHESKENFSPNFSNAFVNNTPQEPQNKEDQLKDKISIPFKPKDKKPKPFFKKYNSAKIPSDILNNKYDGSQNFNLPPLTLCHSNSLETPENFGQNLSGCISPTNIQFNKFNTESQNEYALSSMLAENTEILNVRVKIRDNFSAIFKLRRYDDLFMTVKLFCEIHNIDEKLMKPIISQSLGALNKIYQIYNLPLNKEEIERLKIIKAYHSF